MENQDQGQDLLADLEVNIHEAGSGRRLANWFIDGIFFYLVLVVLVMMVDITPFMYLGAGIFNSIVNRLVGSLMYGLFMGLVEAIFKGKTLGKLITQTRAVNEDGSPITPKTAMLRGLCRAVPFEIFSALGSPPYPWHDRWTHTYVIDERLSMMP